MSFFKNVGVGLDSEKVRIITILTPLIDRGVTRVPWEYDDIPDYIDDDLQITFKYRLKLSSDNMDEVESLKGLKFKKIDNLILSGIDLNNLDIEVDVVGILNVVDCDNIHLLPNIFKSVCNMSVINATILPSLDGMDIMHLLLRDIGDVNFNHLTNTDLQKISMQGCIISNTSNMPFSLSEFTMMNSYGLKNLADIPINCKRMWLDKVTYTDYIEPKVRIGVWDSGKDRRKKAQASRNHQERLTAAMHDKGLHTKCKVYTV